MRWWKLLVIVGPDNDDDKFASEVNEESIPVLFENEAKGSKAASSAEPAEVVDELVPCPVDMPIAMSSRSKRLSVPDGTDDDVTPTGGVGGAKASS